MIEKSLYIVFSFQKKDTLHFGILIGDFNLTLIFLQSFQKRKVNGEEALDILTYRTGDMTKSHSMNAISITVFRQ